MTEQQSDERLDAILVMLESIASLNFSRRLTISSKVDGIDAVASGLNMLSEELEASVVEKSKLEASAKALNEALENTKRTLKELERARPQLALQARSHVKKGLPSSQRYGDT